MGTTLLVISDLHLGGPPGFQMCSAEGRARLAQFVDWAAGLPGDVRLVLNGDVVDFLAEADASGGYSAFSGEEEAVRKLKRIVKSSEAFFDALGRFAASGRRLSVLLGNHDIELSLPVVRTLFLDLLGHGVDFIYDNEALVVGSVLIEHGNRYDGWNMVDYNGLRELRSRLSRREPVDAFAAQPGSELVAQVMNPIKQEFAFVDLLKPETQGVLPILAVLNPALVRKTAPLLAKGVRSWYRGRLDAGGAPIDRDLVAGQDPGARSAVAAQEQLPEADRAAFELASSLIEQADASGGLVSSSPRAISLLLKAFRSWRVDADRNFDVDFETREYLEPAKRLASRGFQAVVFGHTHHAKRVPVEGGVYLNSGTWADLMRLPAAVYAGSVEEGEAALAEFVRRVEANDVAGYRRQAPTFARIELTDSGSVRDAGVFLFEGPGSVVEATTDRLRTRLS